MFETITPDLIAIVHKITTPLTEAALPTCMWKRERSGSDYYWISGEGHTKCLMPESGKCPYCGGEIGGEIQTLVTEGNSPKYNSFSKWKEAASEWASHNTSSSEPELESEMVGTGDSDERACPRWWQTRAIGESRDGRRYIIGVFNHQNQEAIRNWKNSASPSCSVKNSEEGFGWHQFYDQGVDYVS